jgi:hypothetical protein
MTANTAAVAVGGVLRHAASGNYSALFSAF